jgi:hypothetical protein
LFRSGAFPRDKVLMTQALALYCSLWRVRRADFMGDCNAHCNVCGQSDTT